jgi:acylpyruvate hydrolase
MKLVTFNPGQSPRIGIWLEAQKAILDLSLARPGLPRTMLGFLEAGEPALQQAREAMVSPLPAALVTFDPALLQAPIPRPGKLLCMGHNYQDHSATSPGELPEFPNLFLKASSCVIGPGSPVFLTGASQAVDYEGEFCFVIGKRASRVDQAHAMEYVVGYTLLNDVSARDYARRVSQWMLGKSFDTFAPLGPALVTKDEVPDPHQLELVMKINGEERQHSNTRNLIFSIPFLIAHISQVLTLEPGDVVSTGTPSGSGAGRKPPVFLQPGDEMRLQVESIGELFNPVAAAPVTDFSQM